MIETLTLEPGLTLRCCRDSRFKQGCISVQFLRNMTESEAAMNALLPAVLLRGTAQHSDLRSITAHLDTLYGAAVSPMARRVGDRQTVGLYCSFMDDRFALPGDKVLEPMAAFLEELLFNPLLENGSFVPEIVESEKKNQVSAIESEYNDKRHYAVTRTLEILCKGDSFAIPRMGTAVQTRAITPEGLYSHYQKVLAESPIEIFYVGAADAQTVASLLMPIFGGHSRKVTQLPTQTGLSVCHNDAVTETQEVSQGKLVMSYVTDVTNRDKDFAAMQVMNVLFGGGMTSKLFQNVREKLSLCYSIGSSYYAAKGILLVSAGIDFDKELSAREEITRQLAQCAAGNITPEELTAAKEALASGLRAVHDSPSAIESYYGSLVLADLSRTAREHLSMVQQVTAEDVVRMAKTLHPAATYFLKGESHEEA